VLLFSYGSNLAAAELDGFADFVGVALLPDHRLALTRRSIRWGGGVVDVVEEPGSVVWGGAYELGEGALEHLDRKEGAGFAYRRVTVRIHLGTRGQDALTYVVIDKEADVPPATPEYTSVVMGGARARGLPEDWLRELEAVLSGAGSVPGR
jgi:gamma-glutamylcyclotransferase (GGCT)/AIG2-like uncharacterized protein YtfP